MIHPSKFSIVEPRFNKGQQISFFVLATMVLLTIIILFTIYINKNLALQINAGGLAAAVFFVLEYVIAALVFASKAKGNIEFDEEVLKLKISREDVKVIGYWELERIRLGKGKKIHFLTSARTPKVYKVALYPKHGYPVSIKIENKVMNQQSLLPAVIHEISEEFKIPLER